MSEANQFEGVVDGILAKGYAFADRPTGVDPQRVLELMPAFCKSRAADPRCWQTTRSGESEADVGFWRVTPNDQNHSGESKDSKDVLMFARDTARLLQIQCGTNIWEDEHDREFLRNVAALHQAGVQLGSNVLECLDARSSTQMSLSLAMAEKECSPMATSVTRVMHYFKSGGKPHLDRCGLTIHWGDVGGVLYAICPNTGSEIEVSPPEGHVTVFPSVKLEIATRGRIKALRHGSRSEADVARLAMVTFCHLVTDPQVVDSRLAVESGLENFAVIAAE